MRPRHLRRAIVPALLGLALLLPTSAAADARAVVATDKLAAAEARLLKDINRIRVRNGRRPLRLDDAISAVARARSADMAAKRYFAHVEPDGDDADRILDRRDIQASEVAENIGHTFGLTLKRGSNRMADWWYRSTPHRIQMLDRDVNYIGVGIARRGSRHTFTAIFTRSRDRTEPRVSVDDIHWLPSGNGSQVTIELHGVDPKLARGTAGIKGFELERLDRTGEWSAVEGDPKRSKRSFPAPDSGELHIRVRAVDRAGNVSPWRYVRFVIPARRRLVV
jgi:uncharacterized protein YkwD